MNSFLDSGGQPLLPALSNPSPFMRGIVGHRQSNADGRSSYLDAGDSSQAEGFVDHAGEGSGYITIIHDDGAAIDLGFLKFAIALRVDGSAPRNQPIHVVICNYDVRERNFNQASIGPCPDALLRFCYQRSGNSCLYYPHIPWLLEPLLGCDLKDAPILLLSE